MHFEGTAGAGTRRQPDLPGEIDAGEPALAGLGLQVEVAGSPP